MAIWLKEGKSESEIIEADEKVKKTVEGILNDVSKRGDEAVRELSLKFDNYTPDKLNPTIFYNNYNYAIYIYNFEFCNCVTSFFSGLWYCVFHKNYFKIL